ncbi:heavy metal-binding domain-containing protein [Lacipirellula sp.]|uniref:heavy metal-binding domain-containing protein n=1 Tax=Lacipirellula sp. TaxID=2691419 RepID=UPI003D0D945F
MPGVRFTNATASPAPKPLQIIVTTADIPSPYEIVGPVYFQVSNKEIFSSALDAYLKKHKALLASMRAQDQVDGYRSDWGFLIGEWSVGQTDFDKAFFIAVQELKSRATMIGGNAIVGMRQDIDLDSTGWQYFYLQMYGTAVRLL